MALRFKTSVIGSPKIRDLRKSGKSTMRRGMATLGTSSDRSTNRKYYGT